MTKPRLDDPLVSVEHLRETKLWKGSTEHTSFLYGGGLLLSEVKFRWESLESCDDLTEAEHEYLIALNKTIQETKV